MADTKNQHSLGRKVSRHVLKGSAVPAQTPGSLGKNDRADPNVRSQPGDTPGSVGTNSDAAAAITKSAQSAVQRIQNFEQSVSSGFQAFQEALDPKNIQNSLQKAVVGAVEGLGAKITEGVSTGKITVGTSPTPIEPSTVGKDQPPAAAKDQPPAAAKVPETEEERRKRREKQRRENELILKDMYELQPSVSEPGIRA